MASCELDDSLDMLAAFDEIREDILGEIDGVESPSAFAYAGDVTSAPNPGLTIQGVGDVGLPLNERDAKAIISQCQQSPFGKGEQTLIDTSVRNSWQLNPSQLSLRNTAWSACISRLLDVVYRELGLTCGRQNVNAELYKLLLYEEGAFFRSHQDSEKTKGMFGTMVVSLPSQHQGGAVVLKHKKDEYIYKSSKASEFATSFAAWYSDVFHEVHKITGGYRLVLTYNLVQRGALAPQTAADFDFDGSRRLADALVRYNKGLELQSNSWWPSYLIYKLDHPYTEESIGLHSLKGEDYARLSHLNEACKGIDFHLYLAIFSKELQFDEECGYDEEIERDEGFDDIYDLSGTKVAVKPQYCKGNLLDSGYDTTDEDAYESDHEGWTGNEGAPYYRRYRDTTVLIVPPARRVDFCVEPCARNPETILRVLEDFTSRENSTTEGTYEYKQLKRLCELVAQKVKNTRPSLGYPYSWEDKGHKTDRSRCMEEIANVCLKMNWMLIYKDIPIEFKLTPQALEALGAALARDGFDDGMEEIVYSVVKAAVHIEDEFAALRAVSDSFKKQVVSDELKGKFDVFELETIVKLLGDFNPVRRDQGKALSDILQRYGPNDRLQQVVECTLQACKTSTQAAFVMECSSRLDQINDDRPDHIVTILTRVMDFMWANFLFEGSMFSRPTNTMEDRMIASSAAVPNCDTITAVELIKLLDLTQQYSERTLTAVEALEPIKKALRTVSAPYARECVLPLLASICKRQIPSLILPEEYQQSIKSFLIAGFAAVVKHYIGAEPRRPTNYSLPTVACHGRGYSPYGLGPAPTCPNCAQVNAFLKSRTQTVYEVKVAQHARNHLESILYTGYGNKEAMYQTETIRIGSPHTWRITKLFDQKYRTMHGQWTTRVKALLAEVKKLERDEASLLNRGYLGDAFDAVMSCKLEELEKAGLVGAENEEKGEQRMPLSDGNANAKRKVDDDDENVGGQVKKPKTGVKGPRAVEIIDLT